MTENVTDLDITEQGTEHGTEHTDEPEYRCPSCGSDHLAADAIEMKTVYLSASGEIIDERGGHTDFESFRCTSCGHKWDAENEVVRAAHSIAAASNVVESKLTRAEAAMYYHVLDTLQAMAEEEGDGGQIA